MALRARPLGDSGLDRLRLDRLAELIVGFGANVQRGQVVALASHVGKEEATRAVAAAAYKRGARFVDVNYFDPHVKRARIEFADEETLDFVPPWYGERVRAIAELQGAYISLVGPAEPGAMEGLDPRRLGRDLLPRVKETQMLTSGRRSNWCIGPAPTGSWARLAYPDLGDDDALERLWSELEHVLRLDEPDPVAAWKRRLDRLAEIARLVTELRADAIHFQGPGTDLTVGLLPSSRWHAGGQTTQWGLDHVPNIPTEELFTTPDPVRTEGVVRSTRPLVLIDGTVIRGLTVRFENGHAVEIDAETNGGVLREYASGDDGGSRLGEVALVDRESRIGLLGTVFYNTLLDENATSHVALGNAYELGVADDADKERRNRSRIHVDFMIGGDDVDVTAVTSDARRVPLLRGGDWQL